MYESTNYHAIAHLTGHIEGAAKYNSAPKTKASKKIWYYTVKDAAGKTWYHGKGTDVAKKNESNAAATKRGGVVRV